MSMKPPRMLLERQARDIVAHSVDCLGRSGVAKWRLDASQPVEGFARAYDTLVLVLAPVEMDSTSQSQGQLLREALLLLQAVVQCPGYSFEENLAFWSESLALALVPGVLRARRCFPCVVFDWDPKSLGPFKPASQHMLQSCLLDLFSHSPSMSPAGQKSLAYARTYFIDTQAPIECTVSVRYEHTEMATAALIETVVLAAAEVSESFAPTELVWMGVRLTGRDELVYNYHGLSTPCREMFVGLCEALPPPIVVKVQLPRTHQMPPRALSTTPRRKFAPFLSRAIGQADSEWCGRMTELDLTMYARDETRRRSVKPDFACLCTLLPFAQSLQKLRVAVETTNDLLWLAYAMLHPRTKATPWRSLYLDGQAEAGNHIDWEDVCAFAYSETPLATLWMQLTGLDVALDTDASEDLGVPGFVWRTATIVGAADVRFPLDTKKPVRLHPGEHVEVCDTMTTLNGQDEHEDDSASPDIAVVIRGVGCGWVQRRHLTPITDTHYDGGIPRTASLTTLALGICAVLPTELAIVLPLFGPALRHLRAIHQAWFACGVIEPACPQLVSLEMYVTGSQLSSTPMGAMPSVRSIVLFCDEPFLGTCFEFLKGLSNIHTIRLEVRLSAGRNATDRGEIFKRQLRVLLTAKRTVRSLTVVFYAKQLHSAAQEFGVEDIGVDPLMIRRKLAFLSVMRASAGRADGLLGSDAVNTVFGFLGPSLSVGQVVFVDEGGYEEITKQWPENWVTRGIGPHADRTEGNDG